MSKDSKISGIYYGWIVVITGFVLVTVMTAIQNSFGVFFKPLQESFGWSRATTSWVITIHVMVFALFLLPVGWAIDRFNSRVLYSIAAVLIGGALALSSRVTELWQLYLLYGLPLALGLAVCGPVVYVIITRWFTEKRGIALGLTTGGAGAGTLIGAPVGNFLISAYGWRDALVVFGIASFIVVLVCANFFRTSASVVTRQTEDNAKQNPGRQTTRQPSATGMTPKQALRTREFLLVTAIIIFANFTFRVVLIHIAPYATDVGITPSVAALALGTIGAFSLAGRLIMGFFQDKIGPRRAIIICMVIEALSMLALPFIRADLMFFVFAVVFGFSYGGDIPQLPVITAKCFGMTSIAVIYAMITTVSNFTGSFGPAIAGFLFDVTGSYTIIFLGIAVSLLAAVYCVAQLRFRY